MLLSIDSCSCIPSPSTRMILARRCPRSSLAMSPDAVPVVPADEGSEGAALTPVTVGAHQTVRTRPVPGIMHTNIINMVTMQWKQCSSLTARTCRRTSRPAPSDTRCCRRSPAWRRSRSPPPPPRRRWPSAGSRRAAAGYLQHSTTLELLFTSNTMDSG